MTTLTQSGAPGVLSAGPIPHNSIHLLIITTDFWRPVFAHFQGDPTLSRMLSVWSDGRFDPERRQIDSWPDSTHMCVRSYLIIKNTIFKNRSSNIDLYMLPS